MCRKLRHHASFGHAFCRNSPRNLHLPCSFMVMEGRDMDLLLGLDMLKSYQASIDLEKNVLRIQGREIPFLAEHQLPAKARGLETEEEALRQALEASKGAGAGAAGSSSGSSSAGPSFPGSGSTLGGSPAPRLATAGAATPGASNVLGRGPASPNTRPPTTPSRSSSTLASRSNPNPNARPSPAGGGASRQRQSHSEDNIRVLMDLGATREVAISMLDAAGGNVDAAASLMF
ncbi:hypothetical protein GYMLUDRAFT_941387 [Collybiopsis luxurians FD-317 M1]|uniref:Unplaced genomic scaffold GYMLUscaffold_83, whole genome shotgun sequence n=1 Tax=Collybiopsis luxurians FD-317 M1 TaxID=944289 RepID=A0A0D0CE72_9AGAR|nr:hypothetical protein GYMLUDRAFT_941387 [Collybiopsis luxurians FD-317 M1]